MFADLKLGCKCRIYWRCYSKTPLLKIKKNRRDKKDKGKEGEEVI